MTEVCTSFFIFDERTSFIIRESIMGNGKPKTSLAKLIIMLFCRARRKAVRPNRSIKCFHPTQGAFITSMPILKSLKAMVTPYIGAYLKTRI